MSVYMPIPFPSARASIMTHHIQTTQTDVRAETLSGSNTGDEVMFPVVLREARIPAVVHGVIRRIHHHDDAVELDITNTDEEYTEWTTFTLAPDDLVYIIE